MASYDLGDIRWQEFLAPKYEADRFAQRDVAESLLGRYEVVDLALLRSVDDPTAGSAFIVEGQHPLANDLAEINLDGHQQLE